MRPDERPNKGITVLPGGSNVAPSDGDAGTVSHSGRGLGIRLPQIAPTEGTASAQLPPAPRVLQLGRPGAGAGGEYGSFPPISEIVPSRYLRIVEPFGGLTVEPCFLREGPGGSERFAHAFHLFAPKGSAVEISRVTEGGRERLCDVRPGDSLIRVGNLFVVGYCPPSDGGPDARNFDRYRIATFHGTSEPIRFVARAGEREAAFVAAPTRSVA